MSENEQSLDQQFARCENIVEDLLKDRLGDTNSSQRNVNLMGFLINLNTFKGKIERLY